ncbi:hypothetical protein [Roseomonas sp. HF4]|uniref:hypothetical protein n=1 Tax=Roseomonas sp. HF4 TaxID=2562313 RepID=UPI0010C01DC8|nr:hypothetical protein [Roseomonas sp. HF4]
MTAFLRRACVRYSKPLSAFRAGPDESISGEWRGGAKALLRMTKRTLGLAIPAWRNLSMAARQTEVAAVRITLRELARDDAPRTVECGGSPGH